MKKFFDKLYGLVTGHLQKFSVFCFRTLYDTHFTVVNPTDRYLPKVSMPNFRKVHYWEHQNQLALFKLKTRVYQAISQVKITEKTQN